MASKRWNNMIEKYGSEEAAKAEMKRRGQNSSRNLGKSGGFASMSKEQLIEVSKKGVEARKHDISNSSLNGS